MLLVMLLLITYIKLCKYINNVMHIEIHKHLSKNKPNK